MMFAFSLYTNTHKITDEYLENVHKYIEIDEVAPWLTNMDAN